MVKLNKKLLYRYFLKIYKPFRIKNLELRKKIVIYHSILLIIPLISVYSLVTKIYINSRESEVLSSNYQVSQIAMSNIDNYIQQIQKLTLQTLYVANVTAELGENNERSNAAIKQLKDRSEYVPQSIVEDDNSIGNMANWIVSFNKYIHSVFVVDMNGDYIYRIIDNSLTKPFNLLKEPWYENCLDLDGKALLVRTFNIMDYVLGDYYNSKELYVFSVARVIKETNANRKVGVIMININADYLADICSNVSSAGDERILLLDDRNNICYDTEEKYITGSINSPQFDLPALGALDLNKSCNSVSMDNSKYVVTSVVSEPFGWKLIRILPENKLYKSIWELRDLLTFVLLAFIAVSMLLTISIAYGITKPLNKLILTIRSINKGDLTLRFKTKYKDEVGQLGRSFNKMINMIDKLVNTIYMTQIRKREAELHALQAQINPHFIYNTLESIRFVAKSNGDELTAEMAFVLGKLLRYSINIKNKTVTVNDEITHLKNYLTLQNYRFDNRFTMVINIEEDLLEYKMIKLIFQPIVENSIYHGLEMKDEDGVIRLTGFRRQDMLVFDIEDNGCGMTEEQLEQLNERVNDFTTFDQTEGSIGLKNINERIKLQYGNSSGISVLSRLGHGTTVRILLPAVN